MTDTEREYHRQWRARNREKVREAQRRYYETHTDQRKENSRKWREQNRARDMARNRAFYHANKQKRRAYLATNREKHAEHTRNSHRRYPEKVAAYNREYRKRNPIVIRALVHRRRARKLAAPGSFTQGEFYALCAQYNHTCLCCGRSEPDIALTADHVVPLIKGGSNDISNIQPLCFSCNSSKHVRTIDYRTMPANVQHVLWDLLDDSHPIIGEHEGYL